MQRPATGRVRGAKSRRDLVTGAHSMSDQAQADDRRRSQAVFGAIAGFAVIAVLVAVFVIVPVGGGKDSATPAGAPAPSAVQPTAPPEPTPEPSASQPQPSGVKTPAALAKE